MTVPAKTAHYILTHYDGTQACLEAEDRSVICLPADWLPSNAALGATFAVVRMQGEDTASISFQIDAGVSEPDELNIGA